MAPVIDLTPAERIARPLVRLGRLLPIEAAAAGEAIGHVLARIGETAWPEVAWRTSALSDDGFPLEFAWSSKDRALRWTAEVAGPDVPERHRPQRARQILRTLGCEDDLGGGVRPGELRFGAWIGLRHKAGTLACKLYLERPAIPAAHRTVLDTLQRALGQPVEWRMAGITAHEREYYGRTGQLSPAAMRAAMHWASIDCAEPVATLARTLGVACDGHEGKGRRTGISISLRDDAPVATCFFHHPRAIALSGAGVAGQVLRAANAAGFDHALLAALLDDPDRPCGRIGIVGIGASEDGACWLQAGWRPEAVSGPAAPGPAHSAGPHQAIRVAAVAAPRF